MKRSIPHFLKKLSLFTLFALLISAAGRAQQKYTVTGKIAGITGKMKVYLQYRRQGDNYTNDSTITDDGTFSFTGTITRPYLATLVLSPVNRSLNSKGQFRKFYLSNGNTAISGNDLATAFIRGGHTQNEYVALTPLDNPIQDSINEYTWKVVSAGKDSAAATYNRLQSFYVLKDSVEKRFIQSHPDSYVSLDLVGSRSYVITKPEAFESFYTLLSERMKNTNEGKRYEQLLSLARRTAIGQPEIDFTQNDPDGNSISLASLKGKYILVDFWASWCGPCRGEFPYLKKAYGQYKNKNFDILSVSLDDNKQAWVKAIKDNDFQWLQTCDLKGFQSPVVSGYGVAAIPRNFLIDPQGNIIAKDLRGDEVEKELAKVL